MLDPTTILEVVDLANRVPWQRLGVQIEDVSRFVLNHAYADALYVARAEDGRLHGVAFGWPVEEAACYDGDYVDEPEGKIFYFNGFIVADRGPEAPKMSEILAVLKERVTEKWPQVDRFCYQRYTHGNRMKLFEIARLAR